MGVNEKMTAVADAIREKTGGTDLLTLDGMAAAIAGIQAGGGIDGFDIATGSFTPSENITTTYTIDSSLIPFDCPSKTCYVFLFMSHNETLGSVGDNNVNMVTGAMYVPVGNSTARRTHAFVYINTSGLLSVSKSPQLVSNDTGGVISFGFTETYPAVAGCKCHWVVMKEKGVTA